MESGSSSKFPLVVIVGPTASGKTGAAIKLAKELCGEIICADSRTVYAGLDIGTAKPTYEERQGIPHWGLDLVRPDEYFTAADFKRYAQQKIAEIRDRGHMPILVGGTGLYIDAVIFDYKFGTKADAKVRSKLIAMSIEELQNYCIKNNIEMPENKLNKRYLIRTIEQKHVNTARLKTPLDNTIVVGITTEREILRERIKKRAEQLFHDGVVDEATKLGEMYGWDSEAMTGNIYRLIHSYLRGESTLAEIKEKFIVLDWRLAKRQLTWLKRNSYIHWAKLSEVDKYVKDLL